MIHGLRLAHELGALVIQVRSDSQLVIKQIEGEYEVREQHMMAYREEVLRLFKLFDNMELMRLPRSDNSHVNALALFASSLTTQDSRVILIEYLEKPGISKTTEEVFCIEKGHHMDGPAHRLFQLRDCPKQRGGRQKALDDGDALLSNGGSVIPKLFSRSLPQMFRTARSPKNCGKIHEGKCGNHVGDRLLANKMLIED